ncbi:hypothetical protein GCM10025864_15490 [Luteimicrobium album]|uniref:DUF4265 domain-containing protein n=1 Tax=Luteimicrobium album TaxID=1054550 RepID=A0ABQ6I1X6_9MICO|nr:DUF4265 domain-containing protein [Luteimicrobium album]GMA23790.1 hypothetical protein GCM10025864_15490 [Luteimicrobium album]
MMKIAVHSNPIRRPSPSFMVRARLDNVGEADGFEQLWTKRVDSHLFEIACIPFFVYGIALGDVVRADPNAGYLVQEVVRRSGNEVLRIAVKFSKDVEVVHSRLHELLGRLGYLSEWFAPGYVAVNLAKGGSNEELFESLLLLGGSIEMERMPG